MLIAQGLGEAAGSVGVLIRHDSSFLSAIYAGHHEVPWVPSSCPVAVNLR